MKLIVLVIVAVLALSSCGGNDRAERIRQIEDTAHQCYDQNNGSDDASVDAYNACVKAHNDAMKKIHATQDEVEKAVSGQ